jgi:hypothetical protein
VRPVLIKVNIRRFAFILGNLLLKTSKVRPKRERRIRRLDRQIGEFGHSRFGSQTFSRTPFGRSLIIVFHPSSSTLIFVFHPPLYRVVAYSTMNSNDEEDETTIAVATAVVAILYTTVPEKEKRVASVYDQRLCWNRFTETHRHRRIFTRHVCMTLTSFTKLLGYIHDSLLVDSDMASLRGGEIAPEIQLYCTGTLLVDRAQTYNFSWVFPLPLSTE